LWNNYGRGTYGVCQICGERTRLPSHNSTTCFNCLSKGIKKCNKCGKVKAFKDFKKFNPKGIPEGYCKECERAASNEYCKNRTRTDKAYSKRKSEIARQWAIDNPDKYLESCLTSAHNRRAAEGSHTTEQWYAVLKKFEYKCAYCGETRNLTRDHIVPLARGGTNNINNIVPACASCNSSKWANDMVEWYTSREYYDEEKLCRIIEHYKGVI
jgi:5-methylcytosine-specific restriction endonuclease McrA